ALEREQIRQRVHQLAFYDTLTGLPNRIMFSARAEQALTQAEYAGEPAALMFINIDRFKLINDSQGHAAGDGLLRDIALRVNDQITATAMLARLSGDEFALALPQCSAEQASAAAERLLVSIASPLPVGHMTEHPSASIGVAMFPEDGHDINILLRHADLAMNRAKKEGGGRFRFFSSDMNRMAQERVALEAELRQAIGRDQLQLHYQPQMHSAAPHALYGVEALLRWNHPQLGAVSPARFLPVAEEQGMMPQLNAWVLRRACEQVADWRQRGVPVARVSVNLSASGFESPRMLPDLLQLIAELGVQPSDLTLELTESVMLSGQPGVLENLHAIREAGISLSLDDFGTGYSSLSHLHRLPIDELKLDMSFVRDIEHSEDARALTTSVLRIGEHLRKHVVAEGVENEAQRLFLADLGCEVLQGYLFSRPLPAQALEAWLGAQPS
ncbi:EAL domain-containing protein, partial [Xanthomonas perforans]